MALLNIMFTEVAKKKEKLIRNWKIIRVAGHETDTKKGVKSERVEESTMRKIV